jgi:tRNA dimethylallyltransferase
MIISRSIDRVTGQHQKPKCRIVLPKITTTSGTLIVITGPTAIGKTRIAIGIAKELQAEIISADSRQFYKELKIGVAAPTAEELLQVPHHFVGHLSVADNYNVSRFEKDVIGFLDSYFLQHKYAVMVGGSGLYMDAVCNGIDDLPDPDPEIRRTIHKLYLQQGIEPLLQLLEKSDPEYFYEVDRGNPVRIMRALEVCEATGTTYSSLRKKVAKDRPFRIFKTGLNRPKNELAAIINDRVDKMIALGLVDEVKSLTGFRNQNALRTVGYTEIFSYLDGKLTLDEAIAKIKTNTRRYAKRQLTWFRKDNEIHWFHPDRPEEMLAFLKSRLQP